MHTGNTETHHMPNPRPETVKYPTSARLTRIAISQLDFINLNRRKATSEICLGFQRDVIQHGVHLYM